MAINNDQLKKFKEALADIIVSSQGLCTYDACKDVAESEATFLISMLLPEPNIQSSNIKETIRADIVKQPAEGLEAEMEKFFETMPVLEHENIFEDTFQNIARHFAEWGAAHARKEDK